MNKLVLLILLLLSACGAKAPLPLSLEEIPGALRKAFQSAKADAKRTTDMVATQVEHKQFAPASFQLTSLLGDRNLNQEQRTVVSRSLITINANMQKQVEAQEAAVAAPPTQGPLAARTVVPPPDPAAAEAAAALEIYRRTK
jgi:hypothetical protein